MPRRQPPPRLILVTDERLGDALWPALARLPRGAGVVFRHHATPPGERRALFERVRRVARARGLRLILAGSPAQAVGWRADGAHGVSAHIRASRPLLRSRPAHGRADLVAARRAGINLVLLSPVFPTRSHPGGAVLGPVRFGLMGAGVRVRSRQPAGPTPSSMRFVRGSHAVVVPAQAGTPLPCARCEEAGSPPTRGRRWPGSPAGQGLAVRPAGPVLLALGGMTPVRFRRLRALGAEGWAAIDALTPPYRTGRVRT